MTIDELREQVSRCRRLASAMSPGENADSLRRLADEFETMIVGIEATVVSSPVKAEETA